MSALDTSLPALAPPKAPSLPLLSQVPGLLEYRSESDPDGDFIPKTIAGFAAGSLAMFLTLDLGEALYTHGLALGAYAQELVIHLAFMLGIIFVAASLLLVGLKVRADHYDQPLFARHWLNSLGTGAVYSLMIWTPWLFWHHSFSINRFVFAALWMILMAFPAIAAKWTIAPHPHHDLPAPSAAN
jgi:hypothetical protein